MNQPTFASSSRLFQVCLCLASLAIAMNECRHAATAEDRLFLDELAAASTSLEKAKLIDRAFGNRTKEQIYASMFDGSLESTIHAAWHFATMQSQDKEFSEVSVHVHRFLGFLEAKLNTELPTEWVRTFEISGVIDTRIILLPTKTEVPPEIELSVKRALIRRVFAG